MKVIVSLVCLVLIQLVTANPPIDKNNYLEQEDSCKKVCGVCDCDGFYCEDECICECQIGDKDNFQCIADMKKECDKNGLEYEILVQDEEAKERFARQIDSHFFGDITKSFIKTKREPSPSPKPEEAPKEEDPTVGSAKKEEEKPKEDDGEQVGMPLAAAKASTAGKFAIAGLGGLGGGFGRLDSNKLMVNLREFRDRLPAAPPAPSLPALPTLRPFPRLAAAAPAPSPAPPAPKPAASKPLIVQPAFLFS